MLGRYCQICGQENIEPKENFWTMFTHFFNDITHFDGKFFTTLKDLLFKPGFLSAEYMKGKRMSYLNPVRMYVFTSAIFFLAFFTTSVPEKISGSSRDKPLSWEARKKIAIRLDEKLAAVPTDSPRLRQKLLLLDSTLPVTQRMLDDAEEGPERKIKSKVPATTDATSLAQYEAMQAALPAEKKDGWMRSLWNRQVIKLKGDMGNAEAGRKLIDIFLHSMPYMLFASLPLFALILKLLYVRRRKEFYYADHGIFSIHHYIFSFILLLVCIFLSALENKTDWAIWTVLIFIAMLAWPFHTYKAMRRFYKQSRGKTFIKFCLLNLLGFFMIAILMTIFALIAVIKL
ncbi:MAG: DUF3667 domain-containing protein [Chitinophagaceae bacterium]|nr:DUF3667 domain-containing protein [Chitinophagaceae bacterium]